MIKIVKWTSVYLKGSAFVFFNKLTIKKGIWDGLKFSITGFALNKYERKIYGVKLLDYRGYFSIQLGRFQISWNKNGYKNDIGSDITSEKILI